MLKLQHCTWELNAKYECISSSGLFIVKSSCWGSAGTEWLHELTKTKSSFLFLGDKFFEIRMKGRKMLFTNKADAAWNLRGFAGKLVDAHSSELRFPWCRWLKWFHLSNRNGDIKRSKLLHWIYLQCCFWKTWFWSSSRSPNTRDPADGSHVSGLVSRSSQLTHLCFPKAKNKDSSLFPRCTRFHLQKSNLSLQKKHILVFNRKQPELLFNIQYF